MTRINTNKGPTSYIGCSIVLFFMALNVYRMELYILVGLFFCLVVMKRHNHVLVTVNTGLILLFCVSYTIMVIIKGQSLFTSTLTFLICPITAYYIGFMLIERYNVNRISMFIIAIAIGRGLHGLLNMLPYIRDGYTSRNPIDFWTGAVQASTGAGTLFILAVVLLYYSISLLRQNKKYGIRLFIFGILCIFSVIYIGTRGCLVVAAVTLLLCAFVFNDRKKNDSIKIILVIAPIFAFILLAYHFNWFHLQTLFTNSGLYRRMFVYDVEGLEENNRWPRQWYMLTHLLEYPFGAADLTYTHNMWLDIARLTGLIPFTFSVIMTISLLKTIRNGLHSELLEKDNRILLFSVLTGLLLICFAEPILEGVPMIFIEFVMITGMVDKILQLDHWRKDVNE